MSCENPNRFVQICVDGEPVGTGNPLPITGGSGPSSNVLVTDIEDGAGDSVMDAVNDAIRVNVVAGGAGGGAVTIADGADDALGATADAAASSDAGTFSLIALFKRLLQKFTTQFPAALVGGRFDVNIGAALPAGTNNIGDVVVSNIEDGAGDSVMDATNNAVRVNVVAGGSSGGVVEITFTDAADLAITAGGASQLVFGANPDRTGLIIQNVSDEPLWVDFGVAAVEAPPSLYMIGGGLGLLQFPDSTGRLPLGTVNIIGPTTGQDFNAKEAEDV